MLTIYNIPANDLTSYLQSGNDVRGWPNDAQEIRILEHRKEIARH